jgi:hypothetical protein
MFEEIDKARIKIRTGSKIYYRPFIAVMKPLSDLFKATEWLYGEAVKDYNKTRKRISNRAKQHTIHRLEKNNKDTEEQVIRIGSRTLGYVNQLCLMEDILVCEYDGMCKVVYEASGGKIKIDSADNYKRLKERFQPIRDFRNKVGVHTAYTKPRKDDTTETLTDSIFGLFPKQGGIHLGVGPHSLYKSNKSKVPIVTIFGWEGEIKPIFQDWEKLFVDTLKEIHKKCPFENKTAYLIEIAYPHLAKQLKD